MYKNNEEIYALCTRLEYYLDELEEVAEVLKILKEFDEIQLLTLREWLMESANEDPAHTSLVIRGVE
ncbi:MAG: hypothetical protein FWE91_10880 [Defluviitaleaceae bacterium]|nr:hypothetical protein [Defluviitaleaceae bacterium]MCL2835178.1 hypothetical protein [Defluviitaleaceae bacterium]